jgi:hypothetical protein
MVAIATASQTTIRRIGTTSGIPAGPDQRAFVRHRPGTPPCRRASGRSGRPPPRPRRCG